MKSIYVLLLVLILCSCAPEKGPKGDQGEPGTPGESYTEVIYPCEFDLYVTVSSNKGKKKERIEVDVDNFCGWKVTQ